MRRDSIVAFALGALTWAGCGTGWSRSESASVSGGDLPVMTAEQERDALRRDNPVGSYGRGLGEAPLVGIAELVSRGPDHLGRVVRVEGTVDDVCPMRGCWISMADGAGNRVKIKVVDGQIVFPVSAIGHPAVAEGRLTMFELQGEEAVGYLAHLAEEKGQPFDPSTVGEEPLVVWQLEGTGAVISE